MSQLYVDNIKGRTGGAVGAPSGIVVTGVGTFSGNVSVGGTLTYQDVQNVDSVGVITARSGIRVGAGQSIGSDGADVVYYGDGSNLNGVVSGIEVESSDTSVGTSLTAINFTGATVTANTEVGIATVAITPAGLSTESTTLSGGIVTLDLTKDAHKVTATGITTITCTGGTEGNSHIVRIINSGIATVGFSSYFLFPSGVSPVLPTADGSFSQVSFQVHREGSTGIGTQLFTTVAVNFS